MGAVPRPVVGPGAGRPRTVARRHGRDGEAQGVAAQAQRRPLGRDPVARGVGRARRDDRAVGHLHAGDGEVPLPRHLQRERHRADRPVDHRVGHRGPEGALAARHPRRDRALVPGVLRTAGRLRPREPAHHRDPLRRRVALRRERPEDLDLLRADREVGAVPVPHRPDRDRARTQARRHHRVHRRHGTARHRGAADPRDHGRLVVLRGVLHRREGARR